MASVPLNASSSARLSQIVAEERSLLTLEVRLGKLTDQTRWTEQQVPIAPRAFAVGELIHTNDLRVHLGDGWWVEMTANQAAAFVGRKREALQTRIRLLQVQLIESSLPTASPATVPAQPPGLTPPTALTAFSSPLTASSSTLTTSPNVAAIPKPPTNTPTASLSSSIPVFGHVRTLKDEAGKDGLPIIEIIEPPSSPSLTKRKAPPHGSPVSRRTEKQRGEARRRAFEDAEKDERIANERERKALKLAAAEERKKLEQGKGQMKTLRGDDGKEMVDDEGLPLVEIVEPVDDLPPAARSSSLPPLPPPRSSEARQSDLRRIFDDAEAEETPTSTSTAPTPVLVASRSSQKELVNDIAPPLPPPNGLDVFDDPFKLVEELLKVDGPPSVMKGGPVVPVNGLHEILSEDNLPISRIHESVSSSPTASNPFSPSSNLPPQAPVPLPPSAKTPLKIKLSIFEKLEAEEKEMERRERLGLPPLVVEEEVAEEDEDEGEDIGWGEDEEVGKPTAKDKGKGGPVEEEEDNSRTRPAPSSRPKKSIAWSETDHVKEFLSSESPSAPAPASRASFTQPTAPPFIAGDPSSAATPPTIVSGSTMKLKVVERAPAAPKMEGKGLKMGGAKEGGKTGWVRPIIGDEAMAYLKSVEERKEKEKRAASASQVDEVCPSLLPVPIGRLSPASTFVPPPVPTILSSTLSSKASSTKSAPSASVEELPSDEEDDMDSNSEGSFQFSDLDSNEDDGEGAGGVGLDMDEKMQMREAAVEYYRLRGIIQGKGGLSGAGSGTGDLEDRSEFVPLNATVSQSLDSTTLSLPTGPIGGSNSNSTSSASSRFKSSLLTPSEAASVSLPTLIPGGGATGAFAGAIRVGKLENGKLIVGRVGPDGEELDDSSNDEEDEDEAAGELSEAGKEALMWGMVGGVVVQEEDLEKGGEELLKRVKGDLGIDADQEITLPVVQPTRMDFYQAEKTLTVSVYEKGLIPADVRVEFEERQVILHLPTKSIPISPLFAPVNATLCSFRVSSVKIELLLMKAQPGLRWNSITSNGPSLPSSQPPPPKPAAASKAETVAAEPPLPRPSSSPSPLFPSVLAESSPAVASIPPTPPAKVSRFKARQAELKSASTPSIPSPSPSPSSNLSSNLHPALPSTPAPLPPSAEVVRPFSDVTGNVSPPSSPTVVEEKPIVAPTSNEPAAEEVEPPKKKVSRFKASRMKA